MDENKISVNTDDLRDKACPAVKDSKVSLDDAGTYLSKISVPTDFYYYLKINSIKNEISSISTELGKIDKKLIKVAEKFEGAENSGKNVLSSLLDNFSSVLGNFKFENNIIGQDKNVIENVNAGLGFLLNAPIVALTGAATPITLAVDGINNIGYNVLGTEEQYQISFTQMMWDQTLGCVKENRAESLLNTVESSFINFEAGLAKGIAGLGETLVDVATISGTTYASIAMIETDIPRYMYYKISGNEDKFSSNTINAWKSMMSFVAKEHVDNAFEDFYKNNSAGQWLDRNAVGVMKSDGIVTNIASGGAKIAGIIGLTLLTAGAFGAVTGAEVAAGEAVGATAGAAAAEGVTISNGVISAIFAGASGFGQSVQEYWANARDNAKDDEEWRTADTALRGIAYGEANGLWEGLQWLIGAELTNGATTIAQSVRNVALDTSFNALDTPYRAGVDAVISNKDFGEAFNEKGGWNSVATNVAIGLIGSAGGEIFNHIKNGKNGLNQATQTIDYARMYDENPNEIAKILKNRGFTEEYIVEMFNDLDKDTLILIASSDISAIDVVRNRRILDSSVIDGFCYDMGKENVQSTFYSRNYLHNYKEKVLNANNIDNEIQLKVLQENDKFDLDDLFHNKGSSDAGVGLITKEQSIMTDIFVRHDLDTSSGEHGQSMQAIYDVIYGKSIDGKRYGIHSNDLIWQDSVVEDGNIAMQFVSGTNGSCGIVNIPNNIDNFQLNQLKSLNNKIKGIYQADPKYFDSHPMEFEISIGRINGDGLTTVNNLDELIKSLELKQPVSTISNVTASKTAIELSNNKEIALFFNDPKLYIADIVEKRVGDSLDNSMSAKDIFNKYKDSLTAEEKNTYKRLLKSSRKYTKEEEAVLVAFAKSGGPPIDAYLRETEVRFNGSLLDGANKKEMQNTLNSAFYASIDELGYGEEFIFNLKRKGVTDIDTVVKTLDNIIEKSQPLEQSIVVRRGVDKLFYDGTELLDIEPGMVFNDQAFLSTSVTEPYPKMIELSIELPKGTKAAYIESAASKYTGYAQQEVLLGRNQAYEIIDKYIDPLTQRIHIDARLIQK